VMDIPLKVRSGLRTLPPRLGQGSATPTAQTLHDEPAPSPPRDPRCSRTEACRDVMCSVALASHRLCLRRGLERRRGARAHPDACHAPAHRADSHARAAGDACAADAAACRLREPSPDAPREPSAGPAPAGCTKPATARAPLPPAPTAPVRPATPDPTKPRVVSVETWQIVIPVHEYRRSRCAGPRPDPAGKSRDRGHLAPAAARR
jgi:hypothetical protein